MWAGLVAALACVPRLTSVDGPGFSSRQQQDRLLLQGLKKACLCGGVGGGVGVAIGAVCCVPGVIRCWCGLPGAGASEPVGVISMAAGATLLSYLLVCLVAVVMEAACLHLPVGGARYHPGWTHMPLGLVCTVSRVHVHGVKLFDVQGVQMHRMVVCLTVGWWCWPGHACLWHGIVCSGCLDCLHMQAGAAYQE